MPLLSNACQRPEILTGRAVGFCGVMSVFSSLRYCVQEDPTDYRNLYFALGFIPLGLFFDFMDGKVARWREKASLMGQELDSLADLVRSLPQSRLLPSLQTPHAGKVKSALTIRAIDILWCGPGLRSLLPRSPHSSRPSPPGLLRPLRPYPPRSLQRHSRHAAQRLVWEVTIL